MPFFGTFLQQAFVLVLSAIYGRNNAAFTPSLGGTTCALRAFGESRRRLCYRPCDLHVSRKSRLLSSIRLIDSQISQAPCAASAVSENIQYQTYDRCPESVTDLQGCICTQDNNFASISSALSSSVSARCGSTASDDQASAQTVSSKYVQDVAPSNTRPRC